MTDSSRLLADLKRDEGLRLTAYPDPLSGGDPWTIGYGCTGAGIRAGTTWTLEKAEAELAKRVQQLQAQLDHAMPYWKGLCEPRRDVLVNMAYNMGVEGVLAFKNTLAHVAAGEFDAASAGMLASKWSRQVGARAMRLAAQMRSGGYHS